MSKTGKITKLLELNLSYSLKNLPSLLDMLLKVVCNIVFLSDNFPHEEKQKSVSFLSVIE